MKKIIIALAVVFFAGCSAMDRKNPTDPAGTEYIGWTYLGEIGAFDMLTDFTIAVDPSDGKDYIFAIDGSKEEIHKFLYDGTPVGIMTNPAVPVFFNPTGICELLGHCYIIDNISIDAFQIVNLNNAWTDNTVTGDKILSHNNFIFVAVSDPPGVSRYTSDTFAHTYGLTASWTITKGNTTCATCVDVISDLAVHPSTDEILLVDSGSSRIVIFNATTGAYVRTIGVGSSISSVALYGDTIYVPTTDGIRKINYNTGALIDTIANYGEGNGRVVKPGPIELYGSRYIFVGAGKNIKYFETSGL